MFSLGASVRSEVSLEDTHPLQHCADSATTGRKWDISKRFKDFLKFETKLVKNFSEEDLAGAFSSRCPSRACASMFVCADMQSQATNQQSPPLNIWAHVWGGAGSAGREPIPEKNFFLSNSPSFVEHRRWRLEMYINSLAHCPVVAQR